MSKYENLEMYKKCFVEFINKNGRKLALSTHNQNKYPYLLIESGEGRYNIVGRVTKPEKLVEWLKGASFNEEQR